MPESLINKPKVGKPPESNESSNKVVNLSPKETSVKHDSLKPINQVSSAILLARAQREERLRKKAVELGENPDDFVTITKKDRLDSIAFRDRMETDSRICGWAIETEEDPKQIELDASQVASEAHELQENYGISSLQRLQ